MNRPQPLASIKEVAAFLGVPVSTLRFWRRKGSGPPAHKIGGVLRYRWEDVDEFVKKSREGELPTAV